VDTLCGTEGVTSKTEWVPLMKKATMLDLKQFLWLDSQDYLSTDQHAFDMLARLAINYSSCSKLVNYKSF
jgi:hypothetical protein